MSAGLQTLCRILHTLVCVRATEEAIVSASSTRTIHCILRDICNVYNRTSREIAIEFALVMMCTFPRGYGSSVPLTSTMGSPSSSSSSSGSYCEIALVTFLSS